MTNVRVVLGVGAFYAIVGVVLGALAGNAASHQAVIFWRWSAWVLSAIAFGAHIVYELRGMRRTPRVAAFNASAAAALGAFGLAVAANVHSQMMSPPQHSTLLLWSLVLWPVLVMLPAFVVALVAAMVVARVLPHR